LFAFGGERATNQTLSVALAQEVSFYDEDGTEHFIDAILIAEVIVPPSPEPGSTR
jgi:hypothetical protein